MLSASKSHYPAASEPLGVVGMSAMQPIPVAHLPNFQNLEMVLSRGALGGWVEQASPACGAASVAGAWNAIKPAGMQSSIPAIAKPKSDTYIILGMSISLQSQADIMHMQVCGTVLCIAVLGLTL